MIVRGRTRWWIALGLGLLTAYGLFTGAMFLNPHLLGESKSELIEKGDKIIDQLLKYDSRNGCLPISLTDACRDSDISTSNGPFIYRRQENHGIETFSVRIGDFDKDGFYLEWRSEMDQWLYDQRPN